MDGSVDHDEDQRVATTGNRDNIWGSSDLFSFDLLPSIVSCEDRIITINA